MSSLTHCFCWSIQNVKSSLLCRLSERKKGRKEGMKENIKRSFEDERKSRAMMEQREKISFWHFPFIFILLLPGEGGLTNSFSRLYVFLFYALSILGIQYSFRFSEIATKARLSGSTQLFLFASLFFTHRCFLVSQLLLCWVSFNVTS